MDAKEEIRERLAIEEIIGEYVQLKRAGRSWKGLSPFSAEKTPSFVVSPDKQIWHDFSSGRGGDIFSFIMEVEGLDFKGALELLARRAGIDLEQYRTENSGSKQKGAQQKERLYAASEWATKFYQAQLRASKTTLDYVLKKRSFTKQTVLEWRLGYSPNTGDALLKFLRGKGFTEGEIKAAGLTSQRYGRVQDMFRGRLMVPLADNQGRVVGFTARLLEANDKAPKYINTPSTVLYDKSRHVFGLHLAKDAIRKSGFVVLAEGNLDVVQSHQAGVRQVVATAGTALTVEHIKTLARFTGDIRLSFDADKAGIAATERAIPIAAKANVNLQIITLPSGKDPDELIKQDASVWQDVVSKPQYAVDWLVDHYKNQLDLATARGKREFSDVVLRIVRRLPDEVEKDHYVGVLAAMLGVDKDALKYKLAQPDKEAAPARQRRSMQPPAQSITGEERERQRIEQHLMTLALMQPKLRVHLYDLRPEMLGHAPSRQILQFLQQHPDFDGTRPDGMQKVAEYGKISSLIYETLYKDIEQDELAAEARRLRDKLVSNYVRIQKQHIVAALQSENQTNTEELLAQARELDELLRINPIDKEQ